MCDIWSSVIGMIMLLGGMKGDAHPHIWLDFECRVGSGRGQSKVKLGLIFSKCCIASKVDMWGRVCHFCLVLSGCGQNPNKIGPFHEVVKTYFRQKQIKPCNTAQDAFSNVKTWFQVYDGWNHVSGFCPHPDKTGFVRLNANPDVGWS